MNVVALRVAFSLAIPVIVSFTYFGLIATDRFVSESSVVIKSGNASTQSISFGGLIPLGGSSVQDVVVVSDFISSIEMAQHLDEKFALREHYSSNKVDFISRLNPAVSTEAFVEYLSSKISVVYEETTEIISISVQAYTPEMARSINREIIRKSEVLINQLSDRIADDAIGAAQGEVQLALDNATDVSARMSRFAVNNNSLNPEVETSSIFGVISALEGKLAEVRAVYAEKSAYLQESSAEIRGLQNRINGLETEVKRERARLSDERGEGVGQLLGQYQPLMVEEELARQRYAAALMALETARAETRQQKRYLATFVSPNLPDASTEPDRIVDAISAILFAMLFYTIFALCRATIREHIDFAT